MGIASFNFVIINALESNVLYFQFQNISGVGPCGSRHHLPVVCCSCWRGSDSLVVITDSVFGVAVVINGSCYQVPYTVIDSSHRLQSCFCPVLETYDTSL